MNEYKIFLNSGNRMETAKFFVKADSEEAARELAENIIDKSYWDIVDVTLSY